MCVTFSGTVSFFLVPITFVHSETEGQRWVTPSPQRAAYARPPRILPCLSWFHTAASLGPAHVSYVRRTEAAAIKCSISLRCYFTENRAAFGGQPVPGSLRDTHSSDAHNSLQAGQVAPPTARCKTSAELSSLEKRDFSESQKSR